jgi:hypothetical protein
MPDENKFSVLWIGAFSHYFYNDAPAAIDFCDFLISEYYSIPEKARDYIYREMKSGLSKKGFVYSPAFVSRQHELNHKKWVDVYFAWDLIMQKDFIEKNQNTKMPMLPKVSTSTNEDGSVNYIEVAVLGDRA